MGTKTRRELVRRMFSVANAVRGVPDGFLIGNRAMFANLKDACVAHFQYALKALAFTDAGQSRFLDDTRGTVSGSGPRDIPQVYRFVIRADVAYVLQTTGRWP